MKIRKARLNDTEKIAKIEINSGYKWKESKKKELNNAKKLFKTKALIYILENKNKAIGYFVLTYKDKIAYLDFLSVIKSYQGKEIGTKLLKYAIRLSKEKTNKVKTSVWAKNFPAIALYNKFGFYVSGIKRKYYPNKDDKLIMEKKSK